MNEAKQLLKRRIRKCGLRIARQKVCAEFAEHGGKTALIWPPNLATAARALYMNNKSAYDARAVEIIALEDAPL